jgi:hypothetical protein
VSGAIQVCSANKQVIGEALGVAEEEGEDPNETDGVIEDVKDASGDTRISPGVREVPAKELKAPIQELGS